MIAVRQRNPQRSRERILRAALTEFAAKGYAGARVEAIATRAGLNKQLISHHFGGKLGLYRSVMNRRRRVAGGEISADPGPMPAAIARFNELALADPQWIRILLWETLDGGGAAGDTGAVGPRADGETETEAEAEPDDRAARYRERVAWVAAEQAAGRLPSDLEPDMLFLSLIGSALYPVLLPKLAELVCGEDPRTDAFAARYRAHLERFAAHLVD